MMKATTRIVLPHFQNTEKPFALLFWSRDPDASQHGTRDSLGEMVPGINGPSGLAGTRDADTMLGELLAVSEGVGLGQDHRRLRHRRSRLSPPSIIPAPPAPRRISIRRRRWWICHRVSWRSTWLPRCMPLRAPGDTGPPLDFSNGAALPGGSGMLGSDPRHPDMVVAANGGSDLIYLPAMKPRTPPRRKRWPRDIVKFLSHPGLCERDFRE